MNISGRFEGWNSGYERNLNLCRSFALPCRMASALRYTRELPCAWGALSHLKGCCRSQSVWSEQASTKARTNQPAATCSLCLDRSNRSSSSNSKKKSHSSLCKSLADLGIQAPCWLLADYGRNLLGLFKRFFKRMMPR